MRFQIDYTFDGTSGRYWLNVSTEDDLQLVGQYETLTDTLTAMADLLRSWAAGGH